MSNVKKLQHLKNEHNNLLVVDFQEKNIHKMPGKEFGRVIIRKLSRTQQNTDNSVKLVNNS